MTKTVRGGRKALQSAEDVGKQRVADIQISDRATKRVIAPFVRIVRKGLKPSEVEESKAFSFYLQKKPSVLIRDLSSFLSDSVDLPSLLHETADVLKNVTKAAGVTLFVMDPAVNEIYQSKKTPVSDRHRIKWKIKDGSTVAAYVAYKKNYVMVEDILQDDRFPEGIGYQTDQIKAVLCIPVVTPDNECFAVIELYKLLFDSPFTKDDLKIGLIVTGWMGAAIHQNSKRLALQRQQELNDYLLDLIKCYFEESVSTEKLLSEILKFAIVTLNAERGSIFIIDQESTGDDLVADLFDEGGEEEKEPTSHKKPQKIRFGKERGIAGLVARTGITVNLKDASKDTRFNKETDQKMGFITRSILCMPIIGVQGILGVAQVINKKTGGSFTGTDEKLFGTFCVYCAISLHFTKVQKGLNTKKLLNNIYLKLLRLQTKPCIHDISYCKQNRQVKIPQGFNQFSWYIDEEDQINMPQFCLHMFYQVMNPNDLDIEETIQCILSIRKFYRKIPFHNFEHAFNACHCMHLILKCSTKIFTQLEMKGLILAALCLDLDHGGFKQLFLQRIGDDLAYLYEDSVLENYHYYVAMFILETYNIFPKMNKKDFEMLRQEIKNAILATHVQNYFMVKAKLQPILERDEFDWNDETHRTWFKAIIMTAADFSGTCKPFLVAKKMTDNLYAEMYRQGDLEKERGLCTLSFMDRDKTHLIPEDQVNFLRFEALPCYQMLKKVLPKTESLYSETKLLLDTWQEIIVVRGQKCWRQDDSIVGKQYNY